MRNLENQKLIELQPDSLGRMRKGLTKAGTELFIKIYPDTINKEICELFDISMCSLKRFQRELNLYKSEAHIRNRNLLFAAEGRKKLKEIGYKPHLPMFDREYLSQRTKRIWRMEKFRVLNGEPQRTKIKLRQPYTKRRAKVRLILKNKGYIPLTSKDSITWYYDRLTLRSPHFEECGRKIGFTFHPFR